MLLLMGQSGVWTPGDLGGNLLQWFLDGGEPYEPSGTLAGYEVLRSLRGPYATIETPCLTLTKADLDYCNFGTPVSLPGDFTISFAVNSAPPVAPNNNNMIFSGGTTGGGLEMYDTDGGFVLYLNGAGTIFHRTTIHHTGWHLVTITRTGSTVSGTVDGVAMSDTIPGYTGTLKINVLGRRLSGLFYFNGQLANFQVNSAGVDVARWAMQEGSGSTIYDLIGSNNLSVLGGRTATWNNRTHFVRDYCVTDGGRMSSGVFVGLRSSTGLAADGSAITLAAGKFGNANARLATNPTADAGLAAINSESAYTVGADRSIVAPANTKFSRVDTDGDDRFFSVAVALP